MKKLFAGLLMTCAFAGVHAGTFPQKPITIIVPFPPGGSSDMTARIVAPKMSERLGQPVIIDNRGGANGAIGATMAKRAAADGHTLLVGRR